MSYTYKYPRPALTTDCVVFGWTGNAIQVLLIERDAEPFAGRWAFPGGFVEIDEELAVSAARELAEETGIRGIHLEQFHTFDAVDRDPRERTLSVAHWALVNLNDHRAEAADDARSVGWYGIADVPPLAFDHAEILQMAVARLQSKFRRQPVGLDLLPPTFPLIQLRQLYEAVLGRRLAPQKFCDQILATGLLREAGPQAAASVERASEELASEERQYAFDARKYAELTRENFYLDF